MDRFGNTPKDLIGTAYLAYDLSLMAKIATLLGQKQEAATYAKWQAECTAAFNERFVTPDGQVLGGTQTSYVLALHFDFLPEEKRPAAVQELVREIKARESLLYERGYVSATFAVRRSLAS